MERGRRRGQPSQSVGSSSRSRVQDKAVWEFPACSSEHDATPIAHAVKTSRLGRRMEHLSGLSALLNGPFTITVHPVPVVILKGVELHGTAQSQRDSRSERKCSELCSAVGARLRRDSSQSRVPSGRNLQQHRKSRPRDRSPRPVVVPERR